MYFGSPRKKLYARRTTQQTYSFLYHKIIFCFMIKEKHLLLKSSHYFQDDSQNNINNFLDNHYE